MCSCCQSLQQISLIGSPNITDYVFKNLSMCKKLQILKVEGFIMKLVIMYCNNSNNIYIFFSLSYMYTLYTYIIQISYINGPLEFAE